MTSTYNDDIWLSLGELNRQPDMRLVELATTAARDRSVLDCCCGDGIYLLPLLSVTSAVVGADSSAVALERAGRRCPEAKLVLADVDRELPLEDNSFDLVWCVDAIEHLVDTQTALSELRRVLRPGGELIVATPDHGLMRRFSLSLAGWNRHFDPFSPHLRFYTRGSLSQALQNCGFEPRVERHNGMLVARALRP